MPFDLFVGFRKARTLSASSARTWAHNLVANGFSTFAYHPKDVHFMDFELSEFDVWNFVVVSGPSTPTL